MPTSSASASRWPPGGPNQQRGGELWDQERWEWIEVALEEAALGDILAFYRRRLGWHAGMALGDGTTMLHSTEDVDCVQESYRQLVWQNALVGVYRHPARMRSLGAPV